MEGYLARIIKCADTLKSEKSERGKILFASELRKISEEILSAVNFNIVEVIDEVREMTDKISNGAFNHPQYDLASALMTSSRKPTSIAVNGQEPVEVESIDKLNNLMMIEPREIPKQKTSELNDLSE
jgi:hypothetical protein